MKRLTVMTLCLILVCTLFPLTAFADVIYMPNDDFFNSHMEACEYTSRAFTCNGPDGTVTVYKSPESDKVIHTLTNPEQIGILYIYTDKDGIQWGYWEDFQNNLSGWIPMDYLVLVYDSISFHEDFGSEFQEEEGQISEDYAGQEIRFWNYPGSDTYIPIKLSADYMPSYWETYTDPTGHVWAFIGYHMGLRDTWVCLDDPTASFETLYPEAVPTIPEVEITEPTVVIIPKQSLNEEIFIGGAVLVVVIATALILIKKKKT